jgi:glycosyltransferase involved in cell wall biosynthesis
MGYLPPVLEEIQRNGNNQIMLIHWDMNKLTPFKLENIENVKVIGKSTLKFHNLREKVFEFNPQIIYISGWMDLDYLRIVRGIIKKYNVYILTGFDDQWFGTIRQYIAFLFLYFFRKYFFTHAWVSGPRQYYYARKIGFKDKEIVFNLLSCNTNKFVKAQESLIYKKQKYPHVFLFVGRFEKTKGLDLLVSSWVSIINSNKSKDWELWIVGNGKLNYSSNDNLKLTVFDFQPEDSIIEISMKSGCFILPSIFEPHGVVLHEFCCAGLPILSSNVCGANSLFLINGFNGFEFEPTKSDIIKTILKVINTSDSDLFQFAMNSINLSCRVTPKISAFSFLSVYE